jgi:hypothetical protein
MHAGICRFDCLWVLGNCLGIWDICVAAGIGASKGRCSDGLHVISRSLDRMLFLICCKCVCFVILRVRLAIGLGATIMGGASVIHCRGAALAW